jgi:hypothetical protein
VRELWALACLHRNYILCWGRTRHTNLNLNLGTSEHKNLDARRENKYRSIYLAMLEPIMRKARNTHTLYFRKHIETNCVGTAVGTQRTTRASARARTTKTATRKVGYDFLQKRECHTKRFVVPERVRHWARRHTHSASAAERGS